MPPPIITLGELLQLAGESESPELRRTARRGRRLVREAVVGARKAQTELGLLGELFGRAEHMTGQVEMTETAPGVYTPRPRRLVDTLRELQKWSRRSR